jgi:hypothetical protein
VTRWQEKSTRSLREGLERKEVKRQVKLNEITMANWAWTNYVIEGPEEDLKKIEQALLYHDKTSDASDDWEGDVLKALDSTWDGRYSDGTIQTMRGFIASTPELDGNTLCFDAEEAWGITDFDDALMEIFPNIKVYWYCEEEGTGFFETNDKESKYFLDNYHVDVCINNCYASDYFIEEDHVYEWIKNLTNGKVCTPEDVEDFNTEKEDTDDYINVYKIERI